LRRRAIAECQAPAARAKGSAIGLAILKSLRHQVRPPSAKGARMAVGLAGFRHGTKTPIGSCIAVSIMLGFVSNYFDSKVMGDAALGVAVLAVESSRVRHWDLRIRL
jgi:hypothetical protein